MNAFLEIWRNAYVRIVTSAIIVVILYALFRELSSVILLAGLAYLFAYLFHPLVVWVQRQRISRTFGLAFVFGIVIVFLAVGSFLIGSIVNELVVFTQQLPTLVQNLETQSTEWLRALDQFQDSNPVVHNVVAQISAALQDGLSRVTSGLLDILRGAGISLVSRTLGVLGGVLQFFLILVIGTYMLNAFTQIGQTMLELFPKRAQAFALEFSKDVSVAVGGYIRGQLVIAAAVGTMVGIGLAILGVPLALALGFLSAVFNVVPYLGVIISIAPAILLASQFGMLKIILVLLVFVVANQIEAHFLSPNILGRSTDLHPITVILTILAGASLLGIFGGLLAVPLVALAKLLIRKYWLNSAYHELQPAQTLELEQIKMNSKI